MHALLQNALARLNRSTKTTFPRLKLLCCDIGELIARLMDQAGRRKKLSGKRASHGHSAIVPRLTMCGIEHTGAHGRGRARNGDRRNSRSSGRLRYRYRGTVGTTSIQRSTNGYLATVAGFAMSWIERSATLGGNRIAAELLILGLQLHAGVGHAAQL